MSHYKAKTNFTLNGIFYENGDDVKVQNKQQLVKLNELGFIQPLSEKDIQNFGKEPKENTKNKEE